VAVTRLLVRVLDGLATIAVAVGIGYALGALFVWLWAPPPTPENSSPPPEAFLFLWGAVIGFIAVVLTRALLIPRLFRRRHQFGKRF
jgi:uncharacterized membrane protein YedE/YeeE